MEDYMKTKRIYHGMSKHEIYNTWFDMINRTTNCNCKTYKYYGYIGITVCERWKSVLNFIEDMYPSYEKGLSIDRIDVNGNYEPSNCRWATRNTQSRNTRKIRANNTSGYRGIWLNKLNNKWSSAIKINSKNKFLGYFATALEAAKAYDTYVIEHNLEHTVNGVL